MRVWKAARIRGRLRMHRDVTRGNGGIPAAVPGSWGASVGWGCLAALGLLCGCGLVKRASQVPEKTFAAVVPGREQSKINPADLQQRLMSFADDVSLRTSQLLDQYAVEAGTAEVQEKVLKWKLGSGTALMNIATGPSPQANLLDLLALTTLRRLELEAVSRDQELRGVLARLPELARTFETTAWRIAEDVLKPAHRDELRQSIEEWHREHEGPGDLMILRPQEYAMDLRRKAATGSRESDSVFSLFSLDPMLGLDPAVREVTQARLFAERAMYSLQRMPTLIRWQTELLARQMLTLPETAVLISNTTAVSTGLDRISRTAAELPDRIAEERSQILLALESQEGKLRELAAAIRQALEAGEGMSSSLDKTFATFDSLMKRFGVGEPKPAADASGADSRPFDIREYGSAAKDMTAMAAQLDATLKALSATLDSPELARRKEDLERLVAEAEQRLRGTLNYAFMLAAILIAFGFICAVLFRLAVAKLGAAKAICGTLQ